MNCREFEHLWSTRLPDDLPPAARAHLSSCPACAAETEADTAADAALRRIGASLQAVDTDSARAAIRRSLEQRSIDGFRMRWRRPLRFAAAGLTAAALAALLAWPAIRRHGSGHLFVKGFPGSSLPGVFPPPHLAPRPEKQLPDQSHPVRPGVSGNGPGYRVNKSGSGV